MAHFLLLIISLFSLIGCKTEIKPVAKLENQHSAIEIPNTIDQSYQVIALRDLGVVYEGEQLKGEFYLKNRSDSIIEIHQIKATCGCMQIEAEFETIKKDEIVRVGYEIDSRHKEGEEYFDFIFDTSIGLFVVEQKAVVKD